MLYSVVFISAVQLCESARSTHMSPPSCASLPLPIPSHRSRSSQSMELSSLCCTTASHYLSVLHVVVYIWEGPLEKGTATYSSILAWRIPWMEEPGESTVHRGHRESDTTERPTLSLLHSITLTYRFHSETSSQASSPHPQSRIRRPASRSDTRSGSAGLPGSPRHGQVLRVVTDFPDSSSSGSLSWSANLC